MNKNLEATQRLLDIMDELREKMPLGQKTDFRIVDNKYGRRDLRIGRCSLGRRYAGDKKRVG